MAAMPLTERDKEILARASEIDEKYNSGEIKPPRGVGAVSVNIYTGKATRIDPNSAENTEMWKNMKLQDGED